MTKTKKIQVLLLCIALIVSCFLTCFSPTIMNVSASSINIVDGYTDVLDDLNKDENFNSDDFQLIETNYSLEVIQLAESVDNELFIYVYQPSADYKNIVATAIFLSTDENGLTYKNYYLSLLSKQGVFYKYRVDNFFVSLNSTRHYEITSIYRKFDDSIDENIVDDNNNNIDEVNYKVAKHWVFTTTDKGLETICQDIETITITSKFVGFVRYEDGDWWHLWGESACDRHFVAFSTDKRIDRLMEADVFYQYQKYHWRRPLDHMHVDTHDYGTKTDAYAYLDYTQKGNYDNGHYNYVWDRIQNVEDFISSVNISNTYSCAIFDVQNVSKITDENLKYLRQEQWVLSFLETEYKVTKTMEEENYRSTRVGSVSILRLKFETDNLVYNLGVIDNKQSGSEDPINTFDTTLKMNDMFKIILMVLFLIILIVVLWPVLPIIINVAMSIFKILLKIAIWIVSLPFKIFNVLFKKRN